MEDEFTAEIVSAMVSARVRPEIVYAFRKTGMLVTEANVDKWSPALMAEYNAHIEAFFASRN